MVKSHEYTTCSDTLLASFHIKENYSQLVYYLWLAKYYKYTVTETHDVYQHGKKVDHVCMH